MIDELKIKEVVSERLMAYREATGLSRRQAAKWVDIPEKTLYRIENNNTEFVPKLSTLIKLCNFYEKSLSDLFETY